MIDTATAKQQKREYLPPDDKKEPVHTYEPLGSITESAADEIEQLFMGSILNRPGKAHKALLMVEPSDLRHPGVRGIFQICKRYFETGTSFGPDTVAMVLSDAVRAGVDRAADYLGVLPGDIDHLAIMVRELSNRRQAVAVLRDMEDRLQKGQITLDEAVEKINRINVKGDLFPPVSMVDTCLHQTVKARPQNRRYLATINNGPFLPHGVVGVVTATGGVGKTFFLVGLSAALAGGGSFGPIRATKHIRTLVIFGEDDQAEVNRRFWDHTSGQIPEKLHAVSTVGRVGPLLKFDRGTPVKAPGYHWLERTIQGHPGLELLILDPMSRFYGLEENDAGQATEFIRTLEGLSQKYGLTILFSHHTSKQGSTTISQGAPRGSSALVDGCRWNLGLIRMDKATAEGMGITNPRQYVVADLPKNNYGPDLPAQLVMERGSNGELTFCNPAAEMFAEMAEALLELLRLDTQLYTRDELCSREKGKGVAADMKERFPGFSRSTQMGIVVDLLLDGGKLEKSLSQNGRKLRENLSVAGWTM
jgi:hypothetical protein